MRKKLYDWVKAITDTVAPLDDSTYGPRYRCCLTLKDGTFLPCAVLQPKQRIVDLAKRRIREEFEGRGFFGGDDPYGQIVSTFVAGGNRISDYEVLSAGKSRHAIPLSLLSQIHGETTMGWTGWVFCMKDGRLFSYGSSFSFEFFQLPEGYDFSDVEEVINDSFVDSNGAIARLERGAHLPDGYPTDSVFRERVFFTCAVDGV
jgi:hypothetical protein